MKRFTIVWDYCYFGADGKLIVHDYPIYIIGETDDLDEAKKMVDEFDLEGELAPLAEEQGFGTCMVEVRVIDTDGDECYERHLKSNGDENKETLWEIRDEDGNELDGFVDFDEAMKAFRLCDRYVPQYQAEPSEDEEGNRVYTFSLVEITRFTDREDPIDDEEEELETSEVLR